MKLHFWSTLFALAASLCVGRKACAQRAVPDELAELRESYSGVQSVYFEARRRAGDAPDQSQDVLTKIGVAHTDGRFGAYHFHPPAGSRLVPSQIINYNGTLIHELDGLTEYKEYEPGSDYFAFPSPVHQFFVPWVYLTTWIDLLQARADLVQTMSGPIHRAQSDSLGLALEWESPGTLCAVEVLASATRAGVRVELGDYQPTAHGPIGVPHTYVQILDTTKLGASDSSGAPRRRVARAVFDVVKLDINPPDIEDRLAFVPAKLGLTNRRDPATKNVYTPEGTLLYNEDEFLGAFDAAQGRRSRWHPMTIVVIAIGTLLAITLVVKRYRASHA